MIITHKIDMDFGRRGMLPRIDAVQGDSYTRVVELSLYENNVPWVVPGDVSVRIRYRKPDNTGGYYDTLPDDTPAWKTDGNVIRVTLAPQMLTVPGQVDAQVEIVQSRVIQDFLNADSDVLGTFTFSVVVERDPAAGALESEDYINPLKWMEKQIDDHTKEVISGAAVSAEAAAKSASNSQTSANLAAQSAASARGAAEEAKQAAEEAKQVDTLASTAAASAAQAAASESSAWASADQADTSAREAKQAAEEAKQAAEEAKQAAGSTGNTGNTESTVNVTELAREMATVYTWEQWDADPNAGVRENLTDVVFATAYIDGMDVTSYTYADSIELNGGKLVLKDPGYDFVSIGTSAEDLTILCGKYVLFERVLYYIPEDAQFRAGTLESGDIQFFVSAASLISDAARLEIVTSDSPYAYPNEGEQGGFWYIASRQRGEEKEGGSSDGSQNVALTTAQINALDGMFRVCAFTQNDVSAQYNAFRAAFGLDSGGDTTEKTLTSISANYSGGSVPVGTAVTALTGIVVTAHYSDGSTATVTGYPMSGAIAEGSNTISVSYGGMTTTFTVTGVAESGGEATEPFVNLFTANLHATTKEEVSAGIGTYANQYVNTDADIQLTGGVTYYAYSLFEGATYGLNVYVNDGTGVYSDSGLAITKKNPRFTVTYDEMKYNLMQMAFTPTEDCAVRLAFGNKCRGNLYPDYNYLFTKEYDPNTDSLE